MRKWGIRLAAMSLVVGALGIAAPAASATEATPTSGVPCEVILPPSLCAQLSDTGQFVNDTIDRLGPIANETIAKVFLVTDWAYNTVKCTVQQTCWPL
ncbi:MAG: hypothetical protein M3323_09310 [Actinomycetota bacterium]|nr:hypothetical protein [Actinomycetota bacterium]